MILKACKYCGGLFEARSSEHKAGRAQYCSRKCVTDGRGYLDLTSGVYDDLEAAGVEMKIREPREFTLAISTDGSVNVVKGPGHYLESDEVIKVREVLE